MLHVIRLILLNFIYLHKTLFLYKMMNIPDIHLHDRDPLVYGFLQINSFLNLNTILNKIYT